MTWAEYVVCAGKGFTLGFSLGLCTLFIHVLRTYIERFFRQSVTM